VGVGLEALHGGAGVAVGDGVRPQSAVVGLTGSEFDETRTEVPPNKKNTKLCSSPVDYYVRKIGSPQGRAVYY